MSNLYSDTNGTVPTGNFPTNATLDLYAFQGPYSAGAPNVEVFVCTETNVNNGLNSSYWGQPIPPYCFQLTGAIDFYNPGEPELITSRYADFVTTAPAPFHMSLAYTNGVSTITWPAQVGSTYSVYSAPTVHGPWTQTFA